MNEHTALVTAERDADPSAELDDDASVREQAADSLATEVDSKLGVDPELTGSDAVEDHAQKSPKDEAGATENSAAVRKSKAAEKRNAEKPTVKQDAAADESTAVTNSVDTETVDAHSAAAEEDSVDTETDAEAPSNETDAAAAKPRFRWRSLIPRPLTAVLLLLLVAAIVLAAVFGWKLKARNDDAASGQAALAAAKDYAVALTSIDSTHIDGDFSTVLNGATGEFKDMYSQSATQLKPLLLQAKSVSKGHVVAASVQSASSDHAVVLLFVDAEITNVTNPTPRVDRNRILMTMDRVGGHWLASKVDLP
ncbi:hypothetical protein [Nocardia macrotermitis]|uniref:Mce associated membrane protein n=1 Tax=Nocardia macrotermitis TaxID=2585198 RepID=A0A7K0D1L3_9NOCA|nr:hypothetical protein [Nocardia macrotermitis]MQY18844.1 hypothetical protein [Nocardia macrotermitis]